jgi:hypothetical protein
MSLLEELKQHLPITIQLSKELYKIIRKQNVWLKQGTELQVIDVLDSGDYGGIVCVIPVPNKDTNVVLSLTYITINPEHPLFDKIAHYQKERLKRLSNERF